METFDAIDVLGGTKVCVMWREAGTEFSRSMGGSLPDAGGLFSLADASAPIGTDMLHPDPAWLIELVRCLVDHNLVDESAKTQGAVEQELRQYATRQSLVAVPLFHLHRWVGKTKK